MTTIHRAYCVDIGQVTTAREARREYLASKAKGRWTFWCDHAACRSAEVRVVCVNYWRSASDEATYVTPHFKHLDSHLPGCTYEDGPASGPPPTSDDASAEGRGRSSKADDLIDVFDPGADEASDGGTGGALPPAAETENRGRSGGGGAGRDDRLAESKTSFVEDLVDMRNELRAKLSGHEYVSVEVRVKGHASIRLAELFQHVKGAWLGGRERVWHGGCKLLKPRFGLGFKLEFLDKVHEHPVVLYVDTNRLADYRFKRSLLDVIEEADEYTYLTVYAWSTVRWDELRKQYEIQFASLKHLAIYPGRRMSTRVVVPE